jgi:hypothetical protein
VFAPRPQPDGSYLVDDAGLPAGSTLGGPDLCVTLKSNGTIDAVHSLAAGARLLSGLAIRHWDASAGIRLERTAATFVLRPESQIHRYRLGQDTDVEETVFAADADDQAAQACCVRVRLENRGARPLRLASVVVARIAAVMTRPSVRARYDAERGALVIWNREGALDARAVRASLTPASWAVTCDHARTVGERWSGAFEGTVDDGGCDPLGVLHLEHVLSPGESARFDVYVVMLPDGPDSVGDVLARLPPAEQMLDATRSRYEAMLARSAVITPDREVDRGVMWAKANMLRVMRRTPTGRAFTNDPGNSSACVGRDAAWFVHGADWMDPSFSLELLRGFAHRQERDGKIVEWYDLRDGRTHDDGLDVNDDTPLFVLAVWHHVAATGDGDALAELYGPAARAGKQLLAHRDERGLVWCSARGTGARGIVGWRNVIDGYRISGATTELNSETFAALGRLAHMARALGRADDARRWEREAAALHAAIERHLRNPENGLYYLCIDVDGRPRSEVTSDLIFPVINGVSDEATSARIVARLHQHDFWTRAGIRTVPRDAPEYSPTRGSGLLGGVWVAVTFWYAMAAAKFFPEVMAAALASTFSHYARDPVATATVPGEFSEWLHGETLANHGMLLSPWFPPRFVWAAVEGACGLVPHLGGARIAPNVPPGWSWTAARNVPLQGGSCTWLAIRNDALRILATRALESDLEVEIFLSDVTDDVTVAGDDVAVIALYDADRIVVFIGNRDDHTVNVAVLRTGALESYAPVRYFDGVRGVWRTDELAGDETPVALTVAHGSFALVEFTARKRR